MFLPDSRLTPWVRCLVLRSQSLALAPLMISKLPAQPGAVLHIVLDGQVTAVDELGEPQHVFSAMSISGPRTCPGFMATVGSFWHLAVVFQPGASVAITKVSEVELVSAPIEADRLWATAFLDRLDRLRSLPVERLIAGVEAELLVRLNTNGSLYQCAFTPEEVLWLRASLAGSSIPEAADSLGLSLRQFQRRFQCQFGMAPKVFQRLVRFYGAMSRIKRGQGKRALADLAADLGYFDQSHLTREFQTFTGLSPATFQRRMVTDDPDYWVMRLQGAPLSGGDGVFLQSSVRPSSQNPRYSGSDEDFRDDDCFTD